MFELNATQASLLGFLHGGPRTGWDLMQEINATLRRFWNVTQSHVYRELKVMLKAGLILEGKPGARDKRPYELTAAGREAFKAWIHQMPGEEQIRYPLLITLWFGKHLDDQTVAGFLAKHHEIHAARLHAYQSLPAFEDAHRNAVVHYGIKYEEAMLAWLEGLTSH